MTYFTASTYYGLCYMSLKQSYLELLQLQCEHSLDHTFTHTRLAVKQTITKKKGGWHK